MCLLGKVERPGVSWGVLGCPGVIRLTRRSSVGRDSDLQAAIP